jgi:hypothetical protein
MRPYVCNGDPCNLFSFKGSGYLSLAVSILSIVLHFPHFDPTTPYDQVVILAASVAIWNKSRPVVMPADTGTARGDQRSIPYPW